MIFSSNSDTYFFESEQMLNPDGDHPLKDPDGDHPLKDPDGDHLLKEMVADRIQHSLLFENIFIGIGREYHQSFGLDEPDRLAIFSAQSVAFLKN